jgi:hypothetical protein
MFPFGSILSSIPLVVLATAYFIYFGASVFNKVKSGDVSFQGDDEAKIIKNEPVNTTGTVIQFHKLLSCESGIHNDIVKDLVLHDFPDIIPYYIPDRNICSYSGGFNLFSRPPPRQL